MTKIKLVTLKEPCSACIIISNLIKEMFVYLEKELPAVSFEIIELNHIKGIRDIKGIEVEKMPILLLNDEQITAGSLPNREHLKKLVEEEME
ncbi:MAG: thioredoxin family protein [Niameybacter sp.]